MPLAIGLIGSQGKMGKRILSCIEKDPDLSLVWALTSTTPRDSLPQAQVIIDFSTIEALEKNLLLAKQTNTPIIIGTTGLQEKDKKALENTALKVPVFWAANFSLGIGALVQAIKTLSPFLQKKFKVSIEETHHIHKKDKPSGTALVLGEAAASCHKGMPPIESLREGEVIGDHSVFFCSENEKIELRHEILSRDVFAIGALDAAKFLVDKPAKLYQMQDLLH